MKFLLAITVLLIGAVHAAPPPAPGICFYRGKDKAMLDKKAAAKCPPAMKLKEKAKAKK